MKTRNRIFGLITFLLLFTVNLKAQNSPVMYFCENYGANGEEGVSDRFTTGYLTIMVKSDHALGLSDVVIQFDKYNNKTSKFEFYKNFDYNIKPDMDYIYFSGKDLSFDSPGIYRVFLLDAFKKHVTSALLEITQ
jgi:hypothetical protein